MTDKPEPVAEPILTETTRGLVRRLAHERRRARRESGRRQQQAAQSMALVRSFASAVGVRKPNYMSTAGPKPHEYDACRAAALRLRADLIDARAQVAALTHELSQADTFGRGEFRGTSWAFGQARRSQEKYRAQVNAVRALCKDAMKLPTLDDPRPADDRISPRAVLAALDAATGDGGTS